jgi:hypothetical protein
VGIKPNSWKKAGAKISMFAKNVEAQIRRNFSPVFPSGKAAREAIPARLERVQPEHVDYDRKDCL